MDEEFRDDCTAWQTTDEQKTNAKLNAIFEVQLAVVMLQQLNQAKIHLISVPCL